MTGDNLALPFDDEGSREQGGDLRLEADDRLSGGIWRVVFGGILSEKDTNPVPSPLDQWPGGADVRRRPRDPNALLAVIHSSTTVTSSVNESLASSGRYSESMRAEGATNSPAVVARAT